MMDYDGVIIEYKGTNRMRIVGSAQERAALALAQHKENVRAAMEALGSSHRSPTIDGPVNMFEWNGKVSDVRCWKRNNRHAKKIWMRHSKRTKCRYRNKQGYKVSYFPSVRNLVDKLI